MLSDAFKGAKEGRKLTSGSKTGSRLSHWIFAQAQRLLARPCGDISLNISEWICRRHSRPKAFTSGPLRPSFATDQRLLVKHCVPKLGSRREPSRITSSASLSLPSLPQAIIK